MELVLDESGNAKLENGQPVYKDADGVERAIDVKALHASVKTTADQRDDFQSRMKAAEGRLAKYKDGDSYIDPESARRALALEANLDGKDVTELQKQLATVTGERDSLKEQVASVAGDRDRLAQENDDLTIGSAVRGSEWGRENLISAYADHPERIMREYGQHFARDDNGQIVAYHEVNGDNRRPIYSAKDPSKLASVDEALSLLVTDKSLLKAQNPSGGGGEDPAGGTPPPKDKAWDELSGPEKVAAVKAGA